MLIIFSPGGAMLHHSSYATTALLFFCAGVWLATLPRPISIILLAAHIIAFAIIWLAPPKSVTAAVLYANSGYLIVGVGCLLAFAISLRFLPATTCEP